MSRKALFLDRDGVINIDYGHVYEIAKFDFVEGIFELCREALNRDFLIIVITNQAGIAKGYYNEGDFHILNDHMINEFAKDDLKISRTYYCPYHKDGVVQEYRGESEDRKPAPGMLLKAQHDFDIDMSASIMIGDKETDIEAALAAGVGKKILINALDSKSKADIVVDDFSKKNIELIFKAK